MQLPSILPSPRWPRAELQQQSEVEQICARYAERVYHFLYSHVGNREDAEDLTSRVFLEASRGPVDVQPASSVASSLFATARIVLTDHWRRYYRSVADTRLGDGKMSATADVPEPSQKSTPSMLYIAEVLGRLPDRDRRVLELRFVHGRSIEETAQEMGVAPEQVKAIQYQALARAAQLAEGS